METSETVIPILIFLCTSGLVGCREVRIQEGPLYRVIGSPASILCNVSGYEGPPTQNFEWFLYRPSAPDISISIASTKDPDFAYAVFSSRVRSGDISIRRLSGDSTELRLQQLRAEDEGVYECYTPTTDSRYLGSYSAKVALKVIPDTLQVTAKMAAKTRLLAPPQLTLMEGRQLHLSCSASAPSDQHTHLSVTFGVTDLGDPAGTPRDIISIGRDFTLQPAHEEPAYSQRYANGEIQLEKTDNSTYRMTISRLRPQDTGTFHCTAAQWIRDPDGTWQKITQRRSALAQVTVQSIDSQVALSVGPRVVRVESGGLVELFCNVSALSSLPADVALWVEWWVSSSRASPGQLVASMSADGVVSLGERYGGSDVGVRLISLEKLSSPPASFRLRIYSAQPGDVGAYSCHVRAYVSYPGPRLEEVSSKVSPSIDVLMSVQGISLDVLVSLYSATLYRGDTAVLLCNVTMETSQTVQLAVSWWVEPGGEKANERAGRLLASVNREGVSEAGSRYSGEELSSDKVAAHSYRLRLYNVQPQDEGRYHCAVTAWIQYPDRTWYNAASATSNAITLYPYAQAKDLLLIPMIGGVASALFVGVTILSTVTCCYIRRLRKR